MTRLSGAKASSGLIRACSCAAMVLILVGLMAGPAAADTSVVGDLSIAPTGAWNLQDNNAVVRTTPYATVHGWVVSGMYSGTNGYWDGPGINSAAAATDPNFLTALGAVANNVDGATIWATGADLGPAFDLPSLGTLTVNDTIIKYTYYGDADLSGIVNTDDLDLWITGFNEEGLAGWLFGDFNYDGLINTDDLDMWITTFNTPNLAPLGGAAALGSTAVPEPSTLVCVFLAAFAALGIGWCRRS